MFWSAHHLFYTAGFLEAERGDIMIYTNEVPVLKAQERSAVTLGKFDGLHKEAIRN